MRKQPDMTKCTTQKPHAVKEPVKLCIEAGCNRKMLARSMCATHYSSWRRSQRLYTYECDHCGKQFTKDRKQAGEQVFCGRSCQASWLNIHKTSQQVASRRRNKYAKYSQELVPYVPPQKREMAPKQAVWRCVPCKACKTMFLTKNTHVTCSETCLIRWKKEKKHEYRLARRALKRSAYVEPVRRLELYERDGYTCHICSKPLEMDKKAPHPLSPTVDHVIPLARGGEHSMKNCKAAHFICNSRKGDRI